MGIRPTFQLRWHGADQRIQFFSYVSDSGHEALAKTRSSSFSGYCVQKSSSHGPAQPAYECRIERILYRPFTGLVSRAMTTLVSVLPLAAVVRFRGAGPGGIVLALLFELSHHVDHFNGRFGGIGATD